jgi:menaquinone-dependent protoporphyrinogen oxidase
MKVLVAVASKHGSTTEIAEELGRSIAEGIGAAGQVDVRVIDAMLQAPGAVGGYDAVLVGSAVYAGHWLEDARRFVFGHSGDLSGLPVWLFSSGPVGDPPKPADDTIDLGDVVAACEPRAHRVFPGKVDRHALGFAERAIVLALRVPDGDFRDWDAVRAWGQEIARELQTPVG